jgi:DNA topoisomerase-1
MRHLVIVESPSKCKTIEKYLGKDYRVIATCGHFRHLRSLDQIQPNFDIQFKVSKPNIVKYLKEEVGIAKSVYLATDDDREGESIAWHICQICKLPLNTPRLTFHEITSTAIQESLKHPTVLSMSRVFSQHTRQILDLYIGFTISPLLWKAVQHTLSAGRCQTPALHMIVEQEDKIKSQSIETCFHVKAHFTNKRIEFCLERPLQKEEVEPFFSKIPEFVLEPPEWKEVSIPPPPILKTSTFQLKACHALRMSPKRLMSSAQTLYENGLITYMRTDHATYSEDFLKRMKNHLGHDYHDPRSKDQGQGAHEGIRVTQLDIKTCSLEKDADRVYSFLYQYTLHTCMKPTILQHKIYRTLMNGVYFVHVSKAVIEKGWMNPEEKDWSSYLDHLKRFHCEEIRAEENVVHPEFHWSEAQLIQHLEKYEIGRPSTYASIVETLIEKKYVTLGKITREPIESKIYVWRGELIASSTTKTIEESNKLSLTELGRRVDSFCMTHCEGLFNYSYSRNLESYLDNIEKGGDHLPFLRETIPSIVSYREIDFEKREYLSLHAGYYHSSPIIIKDGRHGYYMEYKDRTTSLKEFGKIDLVPSWIKEQTVPPEHFSELIQFLENTPILVDIDENWSLRKGKYGPYLYYKTSKMKKPKFYSYPNSTDKSDILSYIQKIIKR